MLLTLDAGNTNTVIGLYADKASTKAGAGEGLIEHWRLSTEAERTSDEYAVLIRNFLDTVGYDMDEEVTGAAICSGVPRVLLYVPPRGTARDVVRRRRTRAGSP